MRVLHLPPELGLQLEQAARHAGIQPHDLALVLLHAGAALADPAAESAFGAALQTFLREREVSAPQVGNVLGELLRRATGDRNDRLAAWRGEQGQRHYNIPTGMGVGMVKEQAMYAYEAPAPAPVARASAMGRYAHLHSGSEEFARAKAAEIELEDRVRP